MLAAPVDPVPLTEGSGREYSERIMSSYRSCHVTDRFLCYLFHFRVHRSNSSAYIQGLSPVYSVGNSDPLTTRCEEVSVSETEAGAATHPNSWISPAVASHQATCKHFQVTTLVANTRLGWDPARVWLRDQGAAFPSLETHRRNPSSFHLDGCT